jgi:hypothetical protein
MGVVNYDGVSFTGFNRGFVGTVANVVPDGQGAFLLGSIQFAGNTPSSGPLVRWNGANSWETFGTLTFSGAVTDATRFNNSIIISGSFFQSSGGTNYIARWTGSAWDRLGGVSPSSTVNAISVFQDQLVIGGSFSTVGAAIPNIARWNGTAWSPVGLGLNGTVTDLIPFENRLVAIGNFNSSGTTTLNRVGAWNGTEWQALGSGLGPSASPVAAAVQGSELFVAGSGFTFPLSNIARWNGTQWSTTNNAPSFVDRLASVGGVLYAVGSFTTVNSVASDGLAQWNGSTWLVPPIGQGDVFGPGFGTSADAICELADGRGLVAGAFSTVAGNVARGWATFTPGGGQNVIVTQPADFVACPNLAAEFRVLMQNPDAAIYEWRRDGMILRNGRGISGANSNILTIDGVLPEDAGLYQCRITTACGVVVSREASLGVSVQPTCPKVCDDVDFNNDGSIFDPLDIDAFLSVFSEGPCL